MRHNVPFRRPAAIAATLLACVAACGVDEVDAPADDAGITPDTAPDAALDTAPDAAVDAAVDVTPDTTTEPPDWTGYAPPQAPVPRLTALQLRNSLRDVFGADIVVPRVNLPDIEQFGLRTLGAGDATLAPRSVEDLERAAIEIGRQMVSPERRARFVPCEPTGVVDSACATQVVEQLGRRLWRRPLTSEETTRLVAIADQAATALGDFHAGLAWVVPALVQSPNFLFRREVGVANGEIHELTPWELASRLAYVLWNTTPDDALLDAAADGSLATEAGLREQVTRMLADPRAERGLLDFFADLYELDRLTGLGKDPTTFPAMSPELGPDALRETELFLVDLVLTRNADFRELLTATHTFVNRRLAALYGLEAPSRDGFARVELPVWTGRRGLLGQASFLAVNAHPTSTSATLRGLFVREALMCATVDPPPADVDTSIPAPSSTARTLRERIAVHLEDELCASCHGVTDPIGLAFEVFDGIGYWRNTENGAPIDPSGEFEGQPFQDGWELAELIANDPAFTRCIVQHWNRWGSGAVETLDQRQGLRALNAEFAASGYRLRDLVETFVLSPAFRTVSPPVNPEGATP